MGVDDSATGSPIAEPRGCHRLANITANLFAPRTSSNAARARLWQNNQSAAEASVNSVEGSERRISTCPAVKGWRGLAISQMPERNSKRRDKTLWTPSPRVSLPTSALRRETHYGSQTDNNVTGGR